jgi:hypothetical protein
LCGSGMPAELADLRRKKVCDVLRKFAKKIDIGFY